MEYRDDEFEEEAQAEGTDDYKVTQGDFDGLVVVPSDWTVSTIEQHLKGDINVDPDFQRRSVWNKTAKSRFIESLFLGIPIPQILLAEERTKRGSYLVLDGKQRLTTIREFLNDRLDDGRRFTLSGLENLSDINGKTWSELKEDDDTRRLLESANIRTAILKNWKKDAVLYEIFYRLNSGSVKLSPMELRTALYRGPFLRHVIKWTESLNELHALLRLRYPDKRMTDVELTVRHLAFGDQAVQYSGNLKEFLDEYCAHSNTNYDEDILDSRLDEMTAAISAARNVFGHDAVCRRYIPEQDKFDNRFNRAVFDIQVSSLADPEFRDWALKNRKIVIDAFRKLYAADPSFAASVEITTKSVSATRKRFSEWYKAIKTISNLDLKLPNIRNETSN